MFLLQFWFPLVISPMGIMCTHKHCVKIVQIRSFFLVSISRHLDWIRRYAEYLSVFSSNAGKYGPEKTPYLDTFHAVNPRNSLLKHFQSLALCKDWKLVNIKEFFNIQILKGAKFCNFYDPEKANIDSKRNYTNVYVD